MLVGGADAALETVASERHEAELLESAVQVFQHLVAAGAMKLGAHMTPGDYVLQVIVTDKSGDKSRTATQSTDFEVEQ